MSKDPETGKVDESSEEKKVARPSGNLIQVALLTQTDALVTGLEQNEQASRQLHEDISTLSTSMKDLNRTLERQVASSLRSESLTKAIVVLAMWTLIIALNSFLFSVKATTPVSWESWALDLILIIVVAAGSVYLIFHKDESPKPAENSIVRPAPEVQSNQADNRQGSSFERLS